MKGGSKEQLNQDPSRTGAIKGAARLLSIFAIAGRSATLTSEAAGTSVAKAEGLLYAPRKVAVHA
jgi:hypothetical protein